MILPCRSALPFLWLTLAPILWGGNFVAGHALGATLDGVTMNLLRWTFALAVLTPILLPATYRHWSAIRAEASRFALLGLLGVAAFNTILYEGLRLTDVSLAAIVFAVSPLMIGALSAILNKEPPTPPLILGMVVSFGAMFVAQASAFEDGMDPKGALLIFAAALIWSLYSLLLRRRRSDVPAGPAFFAQIVAGTLFLLPVAAIRGAPVPSMSPIEIGALAYLGIGAAALAFWLWQKGIAAVGAAHAGPFMNLVPMSSLVLGWMLLDMPVSRLEIVAFSIVLLGIALANAPPTWTAQLLRPRVAMCLALALIPSEAFANV